MQTYVFVWCGVVLAPRFNTYSSQGARNLEEARICGKWHNIAVVSGRTFDSIIFTYQVIGSKQIRYMDRYAQEGPDS